MAFDEGFPSPQEAEVTPTPEAEKPTEFQDAPKAEEVEQPTPPAPAEGTPEVVAEEKTNE